MTNVKHYCITSIDCASVTAIRNEKAPTTNRGCFGRAWRCSDRSMIIALFYHSMQKCAILLWNAMNSSHIYFYFLWTNSIRLCAIRPLIIRQMQHKLCYQTFINTTSRLLSDVTPLPPAPLIQWNYQKLKKNCNIKACNINFKNKYHINFSLESTILKGELPHV